MKIAISRKNLWEALHPALRHAAGTMLGVIPQKYFLGGEFRRQHAFVEAAQWWSPDVTRAYQLSELKRILTHAFNKSPYYRREFSRSGFNPQDIRSPDDIRALPTINRDTINEHLDEMCTLAPRSANVDYITTGGTSGSPLRFYIGSSRSAIEYAYLVAGWQRAGYRLGTPLAVLRGRIVKPSKRGYRYEHDPLFHNHYFSNFHMNEGNMARYIEHIRDLGPCFLHVYPSSVATLARFLSSHDVKPPQNVLGILAESENVYPDQRRQVETVFSRRYFSGYGHTEKLVAAVECEETENYHVWPTYGYFELLDMNDNPVTTPGQRGEIVGTGFINTVVPFVRYRTGDYATYLGSRCEQCGREHTIISDIRGHRTQEYLVGKDGTQISWTALNVHDDTFDNVLQFQFCQEVPGSAVLKVVPGKKFGEVDRDRIIEKLTRKLDNQIAIRVERIEALQLSSRGKMIYVDQRIPEHKRHPSEVEST